MSRRALACGLALVAMAAIVGCGAHRPVSGGPDDLQLTQAVAAHDVAAVQKLLDAGASPNRVVQFDGRFRSAWAMALQDVRPHRAERVAMIKAMLKAHADPLVAWDEGRRTYEREPMALAMLNPDPDVVRALIEAGVDAKKCGAYLVMAIEGGAVDVAHVFIEAGADPNTNAGAITPLVAAVERRDLALVTYLEAHGAREKP